jgi:uncharacterized protein (UPF0216 family)
MILMKNKKNKKLPQFKKDIKDFLTSEEGKVTRKDITKVALGVLALGIGLAGIMKPEHVNAACGHGSY